MFRLLHTCFMLVALLAASGPLFADEAGDDLDKKLTQTRGMLQEVRNEALEANREMLQFKDRVVYSNATIKVLYLKMKEMEKALLEQRVRVENEIMKLPEYRELVKKRNNVYAMVRELQDEEVFILRQLKNSSGAGSDKGE